jgi:hypothetical protein
MKLVFYPAFFRLRRIDPARALVPATLIAFAATWALHSWQWFWMRGEFLLTPVDALFWGLLALLVTVDAVRESRRGPRTRDRGWRGDFRRAAVTAGTFVGLTLLWSFWNAGTWAAFVALFANLRPPRPADILVPGGILLVVAAWAVLDGRRARLTGAPARGGAGSADSGPGASALLRNGGVALLLLLLAWDPLQERLPAPIPHVVGRLEEARLNARDLALLQHGYYEDLARVDRFSHELAVVYGDRPPDYFDPWRAAIRRETDDYLGEVLLPSTATTYMDVVYTTNAHGMRDRDYPLERTPGLPRVALVGSSVTLGWGVDDDDVFEALAETELAARGTPVEFLNFAVHAYDPVRYLLVLEERVLPFRPDAVVVFCNANERKTTATNLARALEKRVPLPRPFLDRWRRTARAEPGTDRALLEVRLAAVADSIVGDAWRRIADRGRDLGIATVWLYLPETATRGPAAAPESIAALHDLARAAGFDVVADLSGAFRGLDGESLKLFPWDFHPNARGHELLAAEFLRVFDAGIAPRLSASPAPAREASATPGR